MSVQSGGLVVTGYASLDHVMHMRGGLAPDRTTLGQRDPDAWPRAGGCPSYIARAAVAAGQHAAPIMWLGDDADGQALGAELEHAGVDTSGIAFIRDAPSPAALMVYQPDGACTCLFDPAFPGKETLSDLQRDTIARADALCVSVGPPHLLSEILSLRAGGARLYWAVKNDPACFPENTCAMLAERADIIFCSAAERAMVGVANGLVVETRGAAGVRLEDRSDVQVLPAETIDVTDTTGAGDTFIGGFIAADMSGTSIRAAAQQGICAAARLLRSRVKDEVP
ncbi:MAG: carbohydrate kinase family protein [Pseudomonadota bacterium]